MGPSLTWGKYKFQIRSASEQSDSFPVIAGVLPTPQWLLHCHAVVSINHQTLKGKNGPPFLLQIPGFSVNRKDANDGSGRNLTTVGLVFLTTKFADFECIEKWQARKQNLF